MKLNRVVTTGAQIPSSGRRRRQHHKRADQGHPLGVQPRRHSVAHFACISLEIAHPRCVLVDLSEETDPADHPGAVFSMVRAAYRNELN
jgi:hypothetical protein